MIPVRDCSDRATKSWVSKRHWHSLADSARRACMIEYPLINLKMCCMTHKFIGSTRIVNGYLLLGMGNMTLWSPKCNPARQREVRSEYGLRTAGSAAVALFLLLFPALAWSQTPVADEQIVPAEQTQQLASTGASLSQSDAGTPSDPRTAVLTARQKIGNSRSECTE
jgi:hypothetical protein